MINITRRALLPDVELSRSAGGNPEIYKTKLLTPEIAEKRRRGRRERWYCSSSRLPRFLFAISAVKGSGSRRGSFLKTAR